MKTIEEKAKAYDEAFERAKQIRNGNPSSGTAIVVCEQIFPELKESEDERIRKRLLWFLANYNGRWDYPETRMACRAWLEKQKEPKNVSASTMAPSCWQKEQKPNEFKNDELVEIIKGEFEGFRTLLKKKGIDYEPQRGYWEGFARLFDSSAREYVKEQKEQKPISSCDIVPYIDDKIAALQDMWRKEKVAFDWDDMHEMIEDVARHFYQKEQKPTPDWMPKFLDELRSKKNYFDWDGHRDIEGHILAIINWIDPNYFDRKEKEQKPVEKQDYSGLTDFERAIHRGFLCAGVVNVPVTIIKETAQECMAKIKPVEWSEEDEVNIGWLIAYLKGDNAGEYYDEMMRESLADWLENRFKSLRPSWKPSEEQMKGLKFFLDFHRPQRNAGTTAWKEFDSVDSLYNDLLKLKQP